MELDRSGYPKLSSRRGDRLRGVLRLAVVACLGIGLSGCNASTDPGSDSGSDNPALNLTSGADAGKTILARMAAAYRDAPAYRDQGKLTMTMRGPTPRTDSYPFAVEFVRPNKLRIEAYAGTVAIDGKKILGKFDPPEINDFKDQVIELDAPAELSPTAVAEIDGPLRGAISGGLSLPFQIGLLLQEEEFAAQLQKADRVAVLPSQQLDGHDCHCVQIEDPTGRSVWWVDKASYLLRRFEFPVDELAKQMQANPSDVSLVADFAAAEFAPPDESRFTFEVAPELHRLKYLVELPPLPPANLIGEKSPGFAFDLFDGDGYAKKSPGKLSLESLAHRPVMILFWQNNDSQALAAFDRLAKSYAGRTDVQFVAVMTDPAEVASDANFSDAMARMKPSFSVARTAHAAAAFGIARPSAVVFIDRAGIVQDAILDDTLGAVNQAAPVLDAIIADKPWHTRAKDRLEHYRREYQAKLIAAKTGIVPGVQAAPQSPPKHHRLVSVWKQSTVNKPGNIIASPDSNAHLLVIEAASGVAELDEKGQIAARHELKLPRAAEIGFLRAGKLADGSNFFVGSRLLLSKLFVFDSKWQTTLTYPDGPVPENEDNPEVTDIQIADVDGDRVGDILVGYGGIYGMQLITPDGHRRWSNRAVSNVSRLAVVSLDKAATVFVSSFASPTAILDRRGKEIGRWLAQARAWNSLVTSSGTDYSQGEPRHLIGITQASLQEFVAVGLSPGGDPLWEYRLPPGLPSTQVEAIAWGKVVGNAEHWIIAAPDGSLHFLSHDGKLLDQCNVGSLITGMAVTTVDGRPALVVATTEGSIEAFRFDPAEAIQAAENPADLPAK
jgi:hypothetical protein